MSRIVRVLVADANLEHLSQISDGLRNRGFVNLLEMSGQLALSRAKAERPDILILGTNFPDLGTDRIVAELKNDPETWHIPILLVGDEADTKDLAGNLALQADGHIVTPFSEAELSARLAVALRLKTMMSELQNRAVTMAQFGVDGHDGWPDPVTEATAKVLLVGMEGGDPETIQAALRDRADVETVDNPADALHRLASPEIEAVVVAGGNDAQDLLDFCGDIRSTPTLFHLPLLLVFPPTTFADLSVPYREGASEAMKLPFRPEDLRARLFMYVKNEHLRRRMLDAYRGSVHRAINDDVTGLFNEKFLDKHLELLVEDAFRWDKNLSVTVIDLPAVRHMRRKHGSELADRLLKQVGGVISRLVRGEDLCARLGDDSFCVVLPESALEGASVTVQRITGVVSFTDFALPDLNEPVAVQPRIGNTTFKPGDTAAGLVGRAQAAALAAEAA